MNRSDLDEIIIGAACSFLSGNSIISDGPYDIYDLAGPLVFLDYEVSSPDKIAKAWIRLMPDAFVSPNGPIVSINSGPYPFKRHFNGAINNIIKREEKYNYLLQEYELKNREELQRIVCYHYPNLGQLSENELEFVITDLEDNEVYHIKKDDESGSDNKEAFLPYSFLRSLEESGNPGEFDLPTDDFTIDGLQLFPQEKANWCAAASCQMLLNFFGIKTTQSQLALEMRIPKNPADGGASLKSQVEVLNKYLNNPIVADETPLGEECVKVLSSNVPIKNGIFQHAQVIGGWKKQDGKKYFKIFDPLPVGKGSVKLQNPLIIFPMNYVYPQINKQ